ncbi:glycosyltransferase family 2 protein [Ureibacillus sinduriensis]|uniref:Glycosyltransferase n=1 Tax=Ureibacillus sinduriensis BLB-1 = JCM 15800 TaxID=1384057 RepID=A0A0A3HWR0_9BACL|nr:glycosyltransferase family 2 protein [Ureibacillus sinduriensis]KGR76859.1 glycosyltransferase [Ureibacillus sinduriensis BLB-1 = JCM 15800]
MQMPSISLCMIVKNEEEFIERCLKSVHELVHELIIVDTGSNDRTLEICKKYNAAIYPYQWGDHFADARNFGLSRANGDWILWLDADEELETSKSQLMMDFITQTDASMLFMPIINYYGDTLPVKQEQAYYYHQPRLFRNNLGVKFYNRIHETPNFPEQEDSRYKSETLEVPIHHYGYIKEITTKKKKSQRNLHLLQEEYQNPGHSPWIEYHLASEFYRNQDYGIAFTYINESILGFLLQGLKPPAILYRLKYGILYETNSIDGACSSIEKALLLYPDYVELHFIKGLMLFYKEEYSDALDSFEKCLKLGENHSEYLIMKGSGSFNALHYKESCLSKLNSTKI